MDKQTGALVEEQLSSMEIDTIGEIMNISMGAAATSVSTLLDRKVSITTPLVSVIEKSQFSCKTLEPVTGVEIEYIEGLNGSNFLLMKRRDIRAIVDLLIGGDGNTDMDEELDEMHISALCEIMNQMMGASSTALASFFGKSINISTPRGFDLGDIINRINQAGYEDYIVTVNFTFAVENLFDSEFITVLPIPFTKELVNNAMGFGEPEPAPPVPVKPAPAQPAAAPVAQAAPAPQPAPVQQAPVAPATQAPAPQPVYAAPVTQAPAEEAPAPAAPVYAAPARPVQPQVSVQQLRLRSFDDDLSELDPDSQSNFNLILGVPLDITVEIGRTKKQIRDILDIRQGSLLELDKQAGDPVDVIINGQLIAKGDVVVIDDNFGVRITEILSNKDIMSKLN